MAGPITGFGAQQVAPQTQQTAQNAQQNSVRESQNREREPVENVVQPRGSAAAETNRTEPQAPNDEHVQVANLASEAQNNNQRPGSIVDILV